MTKEELKQKLNNEASLYCQEYATLETYDSVHKAYIFSAEPREKRIAELEAQIEKMKCCQNCDNWNWKHNKCEKKLKGDCFKHSKWVMRSF